MPASFSAEFIKDLASAATSTAQPLTVGSLFSCSDVSSRIMECLKQFYEEEYKIVIEIDLRWQVESGGTRRRHLENEFPEVEGLYELVERMCDSKVRNLKTNTLGRLASVYLCHGGFSCTSKSPANNNRRANTNILDDRTSTEATAITYRSFMDLVFKESFQLVVVENLVGLIGDDSQDSDANVVLTGFHENNYSADRFIIKATDFCSKTTNNRLFFVAFYGKNDHNDEKLGRIHAYLDTMKVPAKENVLCAEDFLLPEPEEDWKRTMKERKGDLSYKVEHSNLYSDHQMAWPPTAEAMRQALGKMSGYGIRKSESVYFCNAVWPMPSDPAIEYEFYDAHPSLGRLTNDGIRNPWHANTLPTIVGSSEFVMRHRDDKGVNIRPLTGREQLQFAGWDNSFFKKDPVVDSELGAMAGNCFNGFAVAALYSCIFSVMGRVAPESEHDEAEDEPEYESEDGSSCSLFG